MGDVLDFKNICRICMQQNPKMFSVFEQQINLQIEKICVRVRVHRDDKLPENICTRCWANLQIASDFQNQCEKSHAVLVERMKQIDFFYNEIDDFENDKSTQTESTSLYPCEKCEDKFTSMENLNDHRIQIHRKSPHTCRFCEETFRRLPYLTAHLAIKHPEESGIVGQYTHCDLCDRTFIRKEHYHRHLFKVHKQVTSSYKCQRCNQNFPTTQILKSHEEANHKIKDEVHEDIFVDEEYLSEYFDGSVIGSKIESKISIFTEESTGLADTFPVFESVTADQIIQVPGKQEDDDEQPLAKLKDVSMSSLPEISEEDEFFYYDGENHEIDHDEEAELEDDPNMQEVLEEEMLLDGKDVSLTKKKRFPCDICPMSFCRNSNLIRHKLVHSKDKPYSCETCGSKFGRKYSLTIHMAKHSETLPLSCPHCNKGFYRKDNLKTHLTTGCEKNKMSDKVEICPLCNKKFVSKKSLDNHLKMHNEKRFVCNYCTKAFGYQSDLRDHVRKDHPKEKPFLCTECGVRFGRHDYLVVHMRRHTGEKPFKCKFCDKRFPRKTDLNAHEKYHTGTKPHLCTTCGKGFHRHYNLVIHSRVHTGERPYECTTCGKSFTQANDLKTHVRRHTGERFKCDVCGEGFFQHHHLNRHKSAVHGIEIVSTNARVEKFITPVEQVQQIYSNVMKSARPGEQVQLEIPEVLLKAAGIGEDDDIPQFLAKITGTGDLVAGEQTVSTEGSFIHAVDKGIINENGEIIAIAQ